MAAFITLDRPWGKPYTITVESRNQPAKLLSDEKLLQAKFGDANTSHLPNFTILTLPLSSPKNSVPDTEMTDILKVARNRSSPGPDRIPYMILKYIKKRFPGTLASLLSSCLETACFPNVWKKPGTVVWLHKPGKDPSSPDAYRPITLLSTRSKTLERVIATRIENHLSEHGILSDRQYGFRKHRGTEDAIQHVSCELDGGRAMYNYTAMLTVDISGAFDNLAWDHVIGELERLGFLEQLVEITRDFLSGRRVSSGTTSTVRTKGCPQ